MNTDKCAAGYRELQRRSHGRPKMKAIGNRIILANRVCSVLSEPTSPRGLVCADRDAPPTTSPSPSPSSATAASPAPAPNMSDVPDFTDLDESEYEIATADAQCGSFDAFAVSVTGYVPDIDKENQDSFLICTAVGGDPSVHVVAVFDGHGVVGHNVSQRVTKFVERRLGERLSDLKDEPAYVLKEVLLEAHDDLSKAEDFEPSMSGTTAVVVLVLGKTLYAANIGDSRAVLSRKSSRSMTHVKPSPSAAPAAACAATPDSTESADYGAKSPASQADRPRPKLMRSGVSSWDLRTVVDLTLDHSLKSTGEVKRIEASGGEVKRSVDVKGREIGPLRVWIQGKREPGLAMSRSIGDTKAHSVGVTAEADITEFTLSEDVDFMVVASDGVWEHMSSAATVKMMRKLLIKREQDWARALKDLAFEADRRWSEVGDAVDDITAVLVRWKH
eukprot:Rmarinus@m.4524